MSRPTVEQLRPIDLFDDLSDDEVAEFGAASQLREFEQDSVVVAQGDPAPAFHMLLDGSLDIIAIEPDGREEHLGQQHAPTWIGAIAVITGGQAGVQMRASTAVTIATIEAAPFVELVLSHRPVFHRVMSQVRPLAGRMAAREQNRQRLESLGTMAAGLAHELNNPAAAARRAAADLSEALEVVSSTIGHFVESGIERGQAQELVELQRQALARQEEREALDALDAADAEDELADMLAELGVPEPWRLADPLASAGVDAAWLERVHELAGSVTPEAVQWVAASLTAKNLAAELTESTKRMGALVGAIKAYAYMDRGELVEADIHEGLETTLTVLGHKLKHTTIEVVRDYDRSLPKLTVYGGELNQVWTNLLANAIEALDSSGTITVSTALDGPCVRVDIADDGPEIPPGVREHIFDPFFTTKPVGAGTGLGLDTTRRIVADRHRGSISFDTDPANTVFHVWLPINRTAR